MISIANFDRRYSHEGVSYATDDDGLGATPDNANIRYRGFTMIVSVEVFLRLALPLERPRQATQEHLAKWLDGGKPLGPPSLRIEVDGRGRVEVISHEGRHRVTALRERGVRTVPVQILGSGFRARNLTPERLEDWFSRPWLAENGREGIDVLPSHVFLGQQEMTLQRSNGRRRRNVPVPDELRKDVWYHGTASDEAAKGILREGLVPGKGAHRWAHKRFDLSPLAGAVYLTRDVSEAIKYAAGIMGAAEPGEFGYVFEFSGAALQDVVPDEDYVAAGAWAGLANADDLLGESYESDEDGDTHLRSFALALAESNAPGATVAKRLARITAEKLGPKAVSDLEIGFDLAKWGKRLSRLISDRDRLDLLKAGAPAAHFGAPLKPVTAWRFRREFETGEDEDFDAQVGFFEQVRDGTSLRALDAEKIK